jgi:nucleoside phosphorylase
MPPPESYTVGWICAIDTEFVAAQAFLDEEHDRPDSVAARDNNNYALGIIASHHVVIAVLPDGQYGKASASAVARDMLASFPNVRIGLMVGIGGGAPSASNDIRLGDVVVSSPRNGLGGVFQYDFGKTIQNKAFSVTGHLDQPPTLLRTAVSGLRAQYERRGHNLLDAVQEALKGIKRKSKYKRPAAEDDRLFGSATLHPQDSEDCADTCEVAQLIQREPRDEEDDDPAIHYGVMASADQLMKDAHIRDTLSADKGVLCFEMEAAGLMNHFPCLVIRGICDYADSHKNKKWQGFAALMAAAYAKDLLGRIPPSKVEAAKRIIDTLDEFGEKLDHIHSNAVETKKAVDQLSTTYHFEQIKNWLGPPDPSTNANYARTLRHDSTGAWLLQNPAFQEWISGSRKGIWLHGLAGCGKTVLSTTVLDHLSVNKASDCPLLSFFFDFSDQLGTSTLKQSLHHACEEPSYYCGPRLHCHCCPG